MDHEIAQLRGRFVVRLHGDVDLESSPRARRVLLDCVARGRDVLVDLADVAYIDSSGIASLVEAFQETRRRGTRLALVAVSPKALRVFELARLDRVFPIYPTLEEGIAHGG